LHDYVEKTKKDFLAMTPEEIAFPRGCNNMSKYRDDGNIYSKGCPIHVRGSLLYNHYLKEFNVSEKYEKIQEGDKIKFIFLKEPNTIRENILGFNSKIPKEFGIHSYIDYEMMFQKAFLEPLDTIVKTLGWYTEKQSTLEDLFT